MASAVICGSRVVGGVVGRSLDVGGGVGLAVRSVAGTGMVVVGRARVGDVGNVSGVRVVHVVGYGLGQDSAHFTVFSLFLIVNQILVIYLVNQHFFQLDEH